MVKLIKIGNKYAIRKWSLFYWEYQYLDLLSSTFWWSKRDKFFNDCLADTEEEAITEYYYTKDKVIRKLK